MTLLIEYPPTANHMKIPIAIKMIVNGKPKWVGRMILAPKGKAYYKKIGTALAGVETLVPPYEVLIEVHVPDLIKRDLPNVEKACMDALDKAGVITDDSKITRITMERFEPYRKKGILVVQIKEVEDIARKRNHSIFFGNGQNHEDFSPPTLMD